jgi:peptidoglycan glycosyltransferase
MPGSAFKIITTATGLEAGVINPFSYWEPEREYLPPQTTRPIGNYRRTLCGGDLAEVFRRSCNTPFARTAVELGPERMVAGTEAWGFEQPVPIDLPRPAASTFAPDIDFTQNLPVLALQGFGQGSVQMTPLHMAMVAATVANGGVMMRPYVVDSTLDHEGRVLERTRPEQWLRPINRDTADYLTALMVQVVRDGTARCCMQLEGGVQAAAKTGTAQLNATGEPERSHAWITAFAPAEAPRFAVAVMLKGTNAEISAGTGGTLAGPVAKQVLDAAIAAIPA